VKQIIVASCLAVSGCFTALGAGTGATVGAFEHNTGHDAWQGTKVGFCLDVVAVLWIGHEIQKLAHH